MSKNKLQYDAKLTDNGVHGRGAIITKIRNGAESLADRILGPRYKPTFPAEPVEAGEWEQGDELKITVENLSR